VIFLPGSRETHLLSEPCALVLSVLERGVASVDTLQAELRQAIEDADDDQVAALLHEILDTLGKIGLIETFEGVV